MAVTLEIPYKFPSLNDYIRECRRNKYTGAKMKRQVQDDISWFIRRLPIFEEPVTVEFTWIEGNKKRDYDNVAFAKKFILDAMVECGKLKDDNRKFVRGFKDNFEHGKEFACKICIDTYKEI